MYKLSVYDDIYLMPANSAPATLGRKWGGKQKGEEKGEKGARGKRTGKKGR